MRRMRRRMQEGSSHGPRAESAVAARTSQLQTPASPWKESPALTYAAMHHPHSPISCV